MCKNEKVLISLLDMCKEKGEVVDIEFNFEKLFPPLFEIDFNPKKFPPLFGTKEKDKEKTFFLKISYKLK